MCATALYHSNRLNFTSLCGKAKYFYLLQDKLKHWKPGIKIIQVIDALKRKLEKGHDPQETPKYLGMCLIKENEGLYIENFMTKKKKKDLLHSWVGKINITYQIGHPAKSNLQIQ